MRRMVLSVSVEKRERPHASVRHSTLTFKWILRRGVLPECGDPFQKIPSQNFRSLHVGERRRAMCGLARARLRHSNQSGNQTAFIADEEVAGINQKRIR